MDSWRLLNQYLLVWGRAFQALARPRTWTPFGLWLLVQGALLWFLYAGVRPPIRHLLEALPGWIVPAGFFSYPTHLLLLPSVLYNRFLPVPGALVESLLNAAATWIFVRYALGQSPSGWRSAVSEVRQAYGQLVLLWILNYALLRGFMELSNLALGDLWLGFGRRRAALESVQFLAAAAVNSLLAYSTVVIVLERSGTARTLRLAWRTLLRHPLSTWVTVVVGMLLTVPFSLVLGSAPEWIGRFHPEVVLLVTGASLLAGTLASYLVVAVLTFWYALHRRAG
jgi:hypothetical protein